MLFRLASPRFESEISVPASCIATRDKDGDDEQGESERAAEESPIEIDSLAFKVGIITSTSRSTSTSTATLYSNMDADAHMETVRSMKDLEEAVAIIFQNNFDEDSVVCIVTMMKLLDNLLHQPGNPAVRRIRLGNKAFSTRVGSRVGAIQFLQACGFQYPNEQELELVLLPAEENVQHLITARNLLVTRAVTDLGMSSDALPPFRPPPTLTNSTSTATNATTGRSNADTATPAVPFNPYQGHRHDAKSAAVGANLGPESGYVSVTESQLQSFQRQQAVLEAKLQKPLQDRAWIATLPASATTNVRTTSISSNSSSLQQGTNDNDNNAKAPSDGALLAARAKRQHEEHMKRENGGMTTKAMRDLERIKKQKVYTHVTLTIQFSDGCKLTGKFLPKETVATVLAAVQKCLVQQPQARNFELYVTPPRRLLPLKSTLTEEGLVPAAKIFVSWKDGSTPDKNAPTGSYLEPRLFDTAPASLFPSAQPILGSDRASSTGASNSQDGTAENGKTEKKGSREEELLKRMMGGRGGMGGLGGGGATKPAAKDPKDAKPPGGGGKPKWFK